MKDNLSVKELIGMKEVLEIELLSIIRQKISSFEEQTGVNVNGIQIYTVDSTTLDSPKETRIVTDVSITLNI